MNAREMMEEMLHELASQIVRDDALQDRIIRGIEPTTPTPTQRARAVRVLSRVVEFLRGETGRTGGF
jgi:hypothetical protein